MSTPTIAEVQKAQRILAEARANAIRLGKMDTDYLLEYDKAMKWYRLVDELDMFNGPARVIEVAKERGYAK